MLDNNSTSSILKKAYKKTSSFSHQHNNFMINLQGKNYSKLVPIENHLEYLKSEFINASKELKNKKNNL